MSKSVLLDTSFLISLVSETRENHNQAKGFYKYFLEHDISMILSSIVTSEFCVKQPLSDLPLYNFRMLPFNIPESVHLSKLFETKFSSYSDTVPRISIKDDYKISSQCSYNEITYFITEDRPLYDLLNEMFNSRDISFQPIYLPDGHLKFFNLTLEMDLKIENQ